MIWCVRNAIKRSHQVSKLSHFNYNLCLELTLVHTITEALSYSSDYQIIEVKRQKNFKPWLHNSHSTIQN